MTSPHDGRGGSSGDTEMMANESSGDATTARSSHEAMPAQAEANLGSDDNRGDDMDGLISNLSISEERNWMK